MPRSRRLPAVSTLAQILPAGTEGAKEFARLVDLLIFHDARRRGQIATLFDDAAGDFRGLDSMSKGFRRQDTTGYQYKFFPSPLSSGHRNEIRESVLMATRPQHKPKLKRWILVTPEDFIESGAKKGGGDVSWFENLSALHELPFEIEHWGHKKLIALLLETPSLALFYYPELVTEGHSRRKTIADTRQRYDKNLIALYKDLQFVGMSVYKPEATRGVAIQDIYIPLTIVPAEVDPSDKEYPRADPIELLQPASKHVVLGDPGSGKSTLLRFLALAGVSTSLQTRYKTKRDGRLPIVVILRKYADELKGTPDLGLVEYVRRNINADFSLSAADEEFFEFYLESGQAIFFFDGLDELPNPHFKQIVRDRIRALLLTYPGNSAIVTSRIVGYDEPFRFEASEFRHFRIAPLRLDDMERFVQDWYKLRIENPAERDRNVEDLLRILRDNDHVAIRELAENPLLLTIVALVHRIDAVLPDERVVLYQKCTETLLNTWHTWKYRESEQRNRGRIERRNRARMEAIAHWMQCRSVATGKSSRAVVPYTDLHLFLTEFIATSEKPADTEVDPRDSAADFLEFVKKRAGLLIEAGDEQYSFLHLTFQEYLTATYVMTANEVAGVPGIWQAVSPYSNDPRWHEVIRLLMGGLKSPTSQSALLSKLMEVNVGSDQQLSELLGGLILDGIEPAEERLDEILDQVLGAAAHSESAEDCQRLVRIVRAWRPKETFDEMALKSAFSRLVKRNAQTPLPSVLLAPAMGFSYELAQSGKKKLRIESDQSAFLRLFFAAAKESNAATPELDRALDRLFKVVAVAILTSPETNLAAAHMQGIFWAAGYFYAAKYLFHLFLTSFIGGLSGGPFTEFGENTIQIARNGTAEPRRRSKARSRTTNLIDESPLKRRRAAATNPVERALKYFWTGGRLPAERVERDLTIWEGREVLRTRLQTMRGGDKLQALIESLDERGHRDLRNPNGSSLAHRTSLSDVTNFIVDATTESLRLSPAAQWGCALAYGFVGVYRITAGRQIRRCSTASMRDSELILMKRQTTSAWRGTCCSNLGVSSSSTQILS